MANLALTRLLYGKAHPYGWPMSGAEATIKKLTTADLRGFYDSQLPAQQRRADRGR